MQTAIISPKKLSGTVVVPASKSDSHRSIICASLAAGESKIDNMYKSDDVKATINGMSLLGASIKSRDNNLFIRGIDFFSNKNIIIDCNESASTLRFLIPIAASLGINAKFIGKGKLPKRPIDVYLDILPKHSVKCKYYNELPLEIQGKLHPGEFEVPGNVSSQFISGLLFALPILYGDSTVKLTSRLESEPYVDMTINTINKFGVQIKKISNGYKIPGKQKYKPCDYRVERDFSQAAFFIAAGIIGESIKINGLNEHSLQGDLKSIEIFKKFGADIEWKKNGLLVNPSKTHGIEIDASQVPDLVPILAVVASFSEGITKIVNAARLRIKECDRLTAISTSLNNLGANIKETSDGLIINGVNNLNSGTVDSFNDHRITMALAIASIRCNGTVTITNAQSINKSYPSFFEDFNSLGGNANVVNMG